MTEHPRTVDELFADALDFPPSERAAFFDARCPDPAVRAEVESLLDAHRAATGFLESAPADDDELVGTTIGPYRIEREIGAGGMGRVYLAERSDGTYRQPVALKLLKRGMDTDDLVRRFHRERQVLAGLDHPGIARVLDGGATDDGRPYLVLEYVDGVRLDRWCDDRRLDVRRRVELFRQVCDAVHGAHQRLVVHRDLKPSNLLVTGAGTIKLLDFGVAKLLRLDDGAADVTRTSARPMTPAYASPEQRRGEPTATTSDVYSLGIILYELLVGVRPFEATARTEVDSTPDPPRPSARVTRGGDRARTDTAERRRTTPDALRRQLRGELDWIVLKAIDPDPAQRYPSAAALSDDLDRFLRHEAVRASPRGTWYHARKFVRRQRIAVTMATGMIAFLVAGIVITSSALVTTRRAQADEATATQIAVAVSGYLQQLLAAPNPYSDAGLVEVAREIKVVDVLDHAAATIEEELGASPEVEAAVRLRLGETENALGRPDQAEVHLRRAIALYDDLGGANDSRTLTARNHLANLYWTVARYDDAEPLYLDVLERRRDTLGANARPTLEVLGNLATLYVSMGRPDDALPLARAALDGLRRQAEPDSTRVVIALGTLANAERDRGATDAAEAHYLEQLALAQRTLSDTHPHTMTCRHNLAMLYFDAERYADAAALQTRVVDNSVAQFGPVHRNTLLARNNLATMYDRLGDLDRAIAEHRAILAVREARDGTEARSIVTTLANLGACLRRSGDPAAALPHYERTVRLHREHFGDTFFGTGIVLAGYGQTLLDLGRATEARAALLESRPLLLERFGAAHTRVTDVDAALERADAALNIDLR